MTKERSQAYLKKLTDLFSGYRAEWLHEKVFDLFTEPSYFPQLITSHPCFLEGGRGTGKTTALRSLSYQGQAKLHTSILPQAQSLDYFGMYYRINTNQVRAFSGEEVDAETWVRLFGHYINLEFCELVITFLQWYARHFQRGISLTEDELQPTSVALGLDAPTNITEFAKQLQLAKLRFERDVNNIGDASIGGLSIQGRPIDLLMEQVVVLPEFADTSFFFLIDEYENLDNSQQRVLNTLIKHCGNLYSFKVGVRELGRREKSTVNQNETLNHPADYRLINITKELCVDNKFSRFAAQVCDRRLKQVFGADVIVAE